MQTNESEYEMKPLWGFRWMLYLATFVLGVDAFKDMLDHFNKGEIFWGLFALLGSLAWFYAVNLIRISTILTPEKRKIKKDDNGTTPVI